MKVKKLTFPRNSWVILAIIMFTNCKPQIKSTTIDNRIVLVNLKNYGRKDIAKGLRKITECNPRLLCLNVFLADKKDRKEDSLLSSAIAGHKNTFLVSDVTGENILHQPDPVFLRSAKSAGHFELGFDNTKIACCYAPFTSIDGIVLWSLPIQLASYFEPACAANYLHNAKVNEFENIEFTHALENYTAIDIDELDNTKCEQLSDKLVIVGFLGPGSDDLVRVSESQTMYRSVLLANLVTGLLDECSNPL